MKPLRAGSVIVPGRRMGGFLSYNILEEPRKDVIH